MMNSKSLGLNTELLSYIRDFSEESPALKRIRGQNSGNPQAKMFITPEQVSFIKFIIKLTRPALIIEIGTFLGYSAAAMAEASAENCRIITIEKNRSYADAAAENLLKTGYSDKIQILNGSASEELDKLRQIESFGADMIFIDADKKNYITYFEKSLLLLNENGIIITDNVLFYGNVADKDDNSEITRSIRSFNAHVFSHKYTESCILPVGDGLLLSMKKKN